MLLSSWLRVKKSGILCCKELLFINICWDIGCVIVTFNRLEKLKKALIAYEKQNVSPAYIIVVDNGSTDDTRKYLRDWRNEKSVEKRYVLSLEKNLGGSGGFYAGQKMAMEMSAEWIMLADDDAYPEKDYISGIAGYIEGHDCSNVSVICGSVWENESDITHHRAVYMKHFINNSMVKPAVKSELNMMSDLYIINHSSYVGPIIKKSTMEKAGLCNKDFFIWYDDFEHMYRLEQYGKIGYLPQFKIIHDVSEINKKLSWKTYYGLRNRLYFLKKYKYWSYVATVFVFFLKTILCPLKGKSVKEVIVRLTAIKDAGLGRLGIHSKYKPGWKP